MLVDPSTGQPIYDTAANTVGGQIGMNALGSAGVTPEDIPLGYDLLGSLPSATHTSMWNMGRVGRTMTKGPRKGIIRTLNLNDASTAPGAAFQKLLGPRGSGEFNAGRGFRQTFNPFAYGRLASAENIEPLDFMQKRAKGVKGGYTPFNVLARTGNSMVSGKGRLSRKMQAAIPNMMRPSQGEYAFSPGTLGRINTLGRIYANPYKKVAQNVTQAVGTLNPDIKTAFGSNFRMQLGVISSSGTEVKASLGELTAMSARGTISQSALSYINAATVARSGGTLEQATKMSRSVFESATANDAARTVATRAEYAATKAFQHFGSEKLGERTLAKAASYTPMASRFLGTAGYVLLAGDIIRMGAKVVGAGAEVAMDAGKSVMGSIRKPTMGMGYKDNSVAASARQRGVMAIANSQLNARSVLGVEASSLHAHFG